MKEKELEDKKKGYKKEIESWDWKSIEEKVEEGETSKDEEGNKIKRRPFSLDLEKLDIPPPKDELEPFLQHVRAFEEALLEVARKHNLKIEPSKDDPSNIIIVKTL